MADIPFSKPRTHALTLGCTGLLSRATLALEGDGHNVSYLSRSGRTPSGSNGNAYACDWDHESGLRRAVHQAVHRHGLPELVLAWTHSVSQALNLARYISTPSGDIEFFHVLGSSVNDPARHNALARIRRSFSDLPGIRWHAVCLGFIREDMGSRWLTHEEISAGAITAMKLNAPIYTIGQTAPWKYRPT